MNLGSSIHDKLGPDDEIVLNGGLASYYSGSQDSFKAFVRRRCIFWQYRR